MKYIPINIKTNYELLSSLIKVDDLVSFALENNINAIGVTDSNMFSCMELYLLCKSKNIKLIIGAHIKELNIIVYAKNYNGYISLCNIVSKKNLDTITINDIKEYKDIIVVCTYEKYNDIKDLFSELYIGYNDLNSRNKAKVLTDKVVYSKEILCLLESDNEYLEYLDLIKDKKTIADEKHKYNSHYINNEDEFDIETTYKFNALINIEMEEPTKHIPVYRSDAKEYLTALSIKGLNKRLNNSIPKEYKDRLLYELSVIANMGYINYFLIVYDFVLFAKKNNIMVGPGRGSAAGSLVSYVLGITEIDPLKYGLIFERFLNPERITMPDIDVDFDNTKRDDVIDYVKQKYGELYVGNIISFDTMLPKQVLRDVGRVLNINNIIIDKLCKTINNENNFQELKNNKEFIKIVKRNSEVKELTRISNKLCGLKRNTSTHAAGVVISDIKLSDIMPMYKRDNTIITGYSMEYIEALGLLKMDFLSIRNLNTIFNILNEINKKEKLDINKIPLDDPVTLDLFKNARTSGIFQFESSGMMNFLKQLRVNDFNTLIDAIALYRPGPRAMIPNYIDRKNGKQNITYLIKELEPILKNTYGIMIYQEQVLEILRVVGNYSYAEADIIRRAMSKKKASVIENEKEKFVKNVISKGYSSNIAIDLYNKIIEFSNYGFNKSHSVVYSLVAYQMAYLKAHYPLYFMTYLLNMNKSSDKIREYINESKIYNIDFIKISINNSSSNFHIKDNKIVLPFTIIKNIANNICDDIEKERSKSPFIDFYDFMIRCYQKNINKRVVISLIECGAFDEFSLNKRETINNIDVILNYVSLCKDIDSSLITKPILEECEDFTDVENIDNEVNNYGFYLSHHPVTKYDRKDMITLENIKNYFNKNIVSILMVDSVKTINTKNNKKMCFVKLSDEFNTIEAIMFEEIIYNYPIDKSKVYKIFSKVEKREDTYQLIIQRVENL